MTAIKAGLVAVAVVLLGVIIRRLSADFDVRNLSALLALWLANMSVLACLVYPRRKVFLLLSSLFLAWGSAEVVTKVYEGLAARTRATHLYETDSGVVPVAEHRLVGYAFRGPVTIRASVSFGDEVVYSDVPYTIDQFGRRPCPLSTEAEKHALFFGGSFAFGAGLEDHQTLGCQFQTASEGHFQSTTFAMMGWGASQTLVQLGVDALFSDVRQSSGIAIHSFVDDHIFRTTWKIDAATDTPEYPFYAFFETGGVQGPFRASDRRGLAVARDSFSFFRSFSPTFRNFVKPGWFKVMSDRQAALTTARVLGEARRRYLERFDGEFVVLIWPRSRLHRELERVFVLELRRLEVTVIQIPPLPGDPAGATLHPKDSHPSADEVAWVARNLLSNLETALPSDSRPKDEGL